MPYLLRLLPLLCLILMAEGSASAGSFQVSPTKVYMAGGRNTAVVKLLNDAKENVTVQLSAVVWTQDDKGEDVYKPTEDIIFFPKIATIAGGEEKVVRVGFKGREAGDTEKSYRLFIEELPVTKPGETVLKFALKVGVPVFITPADERIDRVIDDLSISEGRLLVKVRNGGNTHFIVREIEATGLAGGKEVFSSSSMGWYVLPGKIKVFEVALPEDGCSASGEIEVVLDAHGKKLKSSTGVDASRCRKGALPR